jgi:NAD(P)-dependent dehydrogenase (short-subunit alcohol dehydrogenase family)
MLDKVVVITGASAGLGLELSARLGQAGAHVVMACRSPDRAELARDRLLRRLPAAKTTILPLDVAEPRSIARFGDLFADRVGCLDVLINNAGIFRAPLARNSDGIESHLATNYLGPFVLTGTLLPLFRHRPGSRIVNVGSLAHRFGKLRPEALGSVGIHYDAWAAYAASKLALLSHTLELNRRLHARGSDIVALGAHPGMAPTDGAKNGSSAGPRSAIGRWLNRAIERRLPTVADAVQPILYAACEEGLRGGEYYGPGGWLEIAGAPAAATLSARASDKELATRLWSASEILTGARYLNGTTPTAPTTARFAHSRSN